MKVTFFASALKSRSREYIPPILFYFAFNNKSLVAKNCSKVLFDAFHILLIIYFASHFQQYVYSLWLNIFNIKNIQCNEQRLPHLLYFILIKHILILALVVDKQIDLNCSNWECNQKVISEHIFKSDNYICILYST